MLFMGLIVFLWFEIRFYWAWWLIFIALAYFFARYVGRIGVILSVVIISLLIVHIEVASVWHDMQDRPELERDADGVFAFGVICRLLFYNAVAWRFSKWGLRTRMHRLEARPLAKSA